MYAASPSFASLAHQLPSSSNRVLAYALLLRDEYPSTDDRQAVRLDIDYPHAALDLNRWLPLVKWLLAIPHYVVLTMCFLIVAPLVAFAWFAILFTGRFPRGIFRLRRWRDALDSTCAGVHASADDRSLSAVQSLPLTSSERRAEEPYLRDLTRRSMRVVLRCGHIVSAAQRVLHSVLPVEVSRPIVHQQPPTLEQVRPRVVVRG